MKIIRHKFRLNVGFLIPQSVGYSHQFPFAFAELHVADDLVLSDFEGLVTITRTPQGLLVQGDFQGEDEMECGRCLKPYTHTIQWEMTELYAFNSRTATKNDLLLPDDGFIDLENFVREDAQIAIPLNPICKTDCQGLCQVCGADLNVNNCDHEDISPDDADAEEIVSPFSGLKDLLND
ncbi:MAG: YceD family protein [Anaerolineales bacterium]|nr:YceD family protein [Anaerolineales bacterium]